MIACVPLYVQILIGVPLGLLCAYGIARVLPPESGTVDGGRGDAP